MNMAKYQAYALANQTAPKTRQIVMLYDGAIRYLRQAREAMEEGRIEDRYNLLVKASEVVMGLQGCLDFDQGGDVAKALHDFYSSIDARIFTLHRDQSLPLCDLLISELKQMRDIWTNIDQQSSGKDAPQAESPTPAPAEEPLPSEGGLGISA